MPVNKRAKPFTLPSCYSKPRANETISETPEIRGAILQGIAWNEHGLDREISNWGISYSLMDHVPKLVVHKKRLSPIEAFVEWFG